MTLFFRGTSECAYSKGDLSLSKKKKLIEFVDCRQINFSKELSRKFFPKKLTSNRIVLNQFVRTCIFFYRGSKPARNQRYFKIKISSESISFVKIQIFLNI